LESQDKNRRGAARGKGSADRETPPPPGRMKLLKTTVYVGPNVYDPAPLIRMTIDLGGWVARPARDFGEALFAPLLRHMPALEKETLANGGQVWDRLREDPDCTLGEVMAQVALTLQRQGGAIPEVDIARTAPTREPTIVDVLFGYSTREVGTKAGDVARLMLLEIVDPDPDQPFDIDAEIADLTDYAGARALGPSAMALVKAAEARGIPWSRLNDASLIQLGQGKYQKRIEAALTSQTSNIAVEIAKDKEFCARLLHDLGLPVPEQAYARDEKAAVRAAERIGYPVVVKPVDGNHGRGVSINLQTEDEVRSAFPLAKAQGSGVIVESMIQGADHRLLVVGGKLVAAAKREPAHVVGDGKRTVSELVKAVNADPRRGTGHENMLTRIEIDDAAKALLSEHGMDEASVPPAGERVYLKKTANLSTGGTAIDVTDIIHPDNKLMAERAIQAVGLDIGGVDFLTTDITKSYRDNGGAICEINAGPGIRMHIAPSEGQGRDVGGAVMDMLFPPGAPARIPVAALTGTNGKTTTARMLAHMLKMAGHMVGQTSTDAVSIDGAVTVKGDFTGPVAASMVFRDPTVDMAVLETARGGIVRAGLGYRYCDVGAVLNVSSDHLGLGGVDTLQDLADVKRLVVEHARDTAVLNADNPHTLTMAHRTKAKHLCYVSQTTKNAIVREHIKAGKRAVVLEHGVNGDQIVLYDRNNVMPLLWTHLIPATIEGKALHNVENAMFAAAMGYALGLSLEQIRAGLRTFTNSFYQSPGRMNIFDEHGFRVILDYGHNEAAVSQMVEFTQRLAPLGKRIVCLTCPGDRRDEDVAAIAKAAAGKFDHYICHADDERRGRGASEIPDMLRADLIALGVGENQVESIPDEVQSIDRALSLARRNDLVLMFCAGISRAWKRIIYFKTSEPTSAAHETHTETDQTLDIPDKFVLVRDERGVLVAPKD
jgi:cyanophycin synthetase